MVYIYVLKLINGKYYVGKTSNPYFRIESHFNTEGSIWTKIHKPIKLLELVEGDDYDEDKYTKIYMDRYGIDNVRGGSYTSVKLDKETKNQLIKISNNINNRCFKCGKEGHFAKECISSEITQFSYSLDKNEKCYVCGKYDHKSSDCKSTMWCCSKCDKNFDTKIKCIRHEQYCIQIITPIKKINSLYNDNISLETLQKLKHYKIKCGDIVLNNHQYNTLQEIIDDTNRIIKYDENDLMKLSQINSDSAITIKTYLPNVKNNVYDGISQLLTLIPKDICNLLQSGTRFDEIEYNNNN